MKLDAFAGKRTAILGYGREGQAAVALLRDRHPDLDLTVFAGDAGLDGAAPGAGVQVEAGLPSAERLGQFDVAVRSPGISPYLPDLEIARRRGVHFTSGTAIWFAEHPGARTVAITGTKGKSTTAALTAHLLRDRGEEVALGGNIGVPLLQLMQPEPVPDLWVMELSSYQLHGFKARPSVAVVLNLSPEHLDWHGSDRRYYTDKLSMLDSLGGNPAVLNFADETLRAHLPEVDLIHWFNAAGGVHSRDGAVWDGPRRLFGLENYRLPGAHNRSNLCAALTVLRVLGFDPALAACAAASFEPLPHRLQSLGRRDGIEYVNDSISTTPRSVMAAVDCYPGRALTLLAGGYDRGLDWGEFGRYAHGRPVDVLITFGPAGARIRKAVEQAGFTESRCAAAASLAEAVALAQKLTPAGGVVLLSPGAPSFDAFRDYGERGAEFARAAGFAAAEAS